MISYTNVNKLLIQSGDSTEMLFLEKLALHQSETRLVDDAMIRTAEVSLSLDGNLEAIVEQRRPIARIMKGQGQYLDDDNKLMPLSKEHTVRVPLIYGFRTEFQDDIFELITSLKADSLLEKSFTDVRIDVQRGFVLAPRAYEYEVVLGEIDNHQIKLEKYKAFVAKMAKDNKLEELKTVDLRYRKQVITTKKQAL